MKIQPLKDYLLIKPLDAEETTSGLYVPTDENAKIKRGEVVGVGDYLSGQNVILTGSNYLPPEAKYKNGDVVLYSIYGANELRDGNQKLFLVQDKEIWAKEIKE